MGIELTLQAPTLNETEEQVEAIDITAIDEVETVTPEAQQLVHDAILSDEEKQQVEDFSKTIDIEDSQVILTYGASAQQKMTGFSEKALESVKTKDLGETGDMLAGLVKQLNDFEPEEESQGFFSKLFKNSKKEVEGLTAKYEKAETSITKVVKQLEKHQLTLMKDITLMDTMYEKNLENYKEITMYIIAGKKRLEECKKTELARLQAKARESGRPEDAQEAQDYVEKLNRFEKKLHDLELTRTISLQMAPQIRMVQNNDSVMAEKIQSVIMNTIPLWKSQMVLALGLNHSKQAMEAERAVNETTNKLLRKNAETLHMSSVEIAKASERGIVDIETLKHTNQELIATFDEVLQVQREGHEKRMQAEQELLAIENELKETLLNKANYLS